MHEPIEDGVGEGGFADEVVPGFDGELADDQRRGAIMRMPPVKHALRCAREAASIRSVCHKLERRQHYVWT